MNTNRVWYDSHADIKSPDTIHQILMFGKLSQIQSLKKTLGESTIKELFLRYPKKVYTAPALNFIKNFILGITISLDDKQYLKYTPRTIR